MRGASVKKCRLTPSTLFCLGRSLDAIGYTSFVSLTEGWSEIPNGARMT